MECIFTKDYLHFSVNNLN